MTTSLLVPWRRVLDRFRFRFLPWRFPSCRLWSAIGPRATRPCEEYVVDGPARPRPCPDRPMDTERPRAIPSVPANAREDTDRHSARVGSSVPGGGSGLWCPQRREVQGRPSAVQQGLTAGRRGLFWSVLRHGSPTGWRGLELEGATRHAYASRVGAAGGAGRPGGTAAALAALAFGRIGWLATRLRSKR